MFKPIYKLEEVMLNSAKAVAAESGHRLLPVIRTGFGYMAFCKSCGLRFNINVDMDDQLSPEFTQECDHRIDGMFTGNIVQKYEEIRHRDDFGNLDDGLVFIAVVETLLLNGHQFPYFVRINPDVDDPIYVGFCSKCGRIAFSRSTASSISAPVGGDAMLKKCGVSYVEEIMINAVKDMMREATQQSKEVEEMKKRLAKGNLTMNDVMIFVNTSARCEVCDEHLGPKDSDRNHHCDVDESGGFHHFCAEHCPACSKGRK